MAIVRIEHLLVLLSRLVQLLRTVGREHRVDDVQRVLHAIVRNGGVALSQIPYGNAVDAQNVVGGVFGDVSLNARLMTAILARFAAPRCLLTSMNTVFTEFAVA